MKPPMALLFVMATVAACAQDAAAVLGRYVQVSGGDLYKRFNAVHVFYTVTHEDKTKDNVDFFHARDGRTFIESDSGTDVIDTGLSDGTVWSYSPKTGVKILAGKQAARFVAEYTGLDEDDWHSRYPTAVLLPDQLVNSTACKHVKLTRTDGSTVERFYDVKTGLLVREVSTEFDDAGVEQPTTTDFRRYDTFFGIRRASELQIKMGTKAMAVELNNVTYLTNAEAASFQIPQPVVRAILASRAKPGDLPNPVELIDKYVAATGGKEAYDAVDTEIVRAEVAYTTDNVKFAMTTYVEGERQYSVWDIPSLGKFESGDDGQIAWEKSTVMGPKLKARSAGGGLTGPGPGEILKWSEDALNMETTGKDQVNGASCYVVRMGAKSAETSATACFDEKTGLLVKTNLPGADGPVQEIYSDYRKVNGILVCQRIDTKIAGHEASVQIKEISVNAKMPPGIFDLPADITALKAKREAAKAKAPVDADRPTLKRPDKP